MEVEEGQREEGREDEAERPLADQRPAGTLAEEKPLDRAARGGPRAPTRPWLGNASYRQPKAVLLFLRGLQGRQSTEVFLHI